MTPKWRLGLLAAFAALAVAAIAGWTRKPAPAAGVSYAANAEPVAAPAPAYSQPANYTQAVAPETQRYDQYGQPIPSGPAGSGSYNAGSYAADPCEQPLSTLPAYATPRYVRTVHVDEPSGPVYQEPAYEERDREYAPTSYRRHHRRSTGKSVAIVAGSAGVGAAIGAIAGGGKGAGIGALAGGAGGFIYDRLTHNR